MQDEHVLNTIPVGPLGLIPIDGCQELGRKVDAYLAAWRCERQHEHKGSVLFSEYEKESFIIESHVPRFGTGEAKGVIDKSVRGDDLFLMVDVCNYSLTYTVVRPY